MKAGTLLSAADTGMIRGERVLFRNVSLSLAPGQAIVLRGANGSGKTTLLRILAGLTRAETGTVDRPAPFHWIAHRDGLKPHETPRTHLTLWARAWGCPVDGIETILDRMGLARPADVPARHLSAGQRRRTALARLHLHDRPLWLLDEPFTALDRDGTALLTDMMTAHCAAGGGIVAAIHGETGFNFDMQVEI